MLLAHFNKFPSETSKQIGKNFVCLNSVHSLISKLSYSFVKQGDKETNNVYLANNQLPIFVGNQATKYKMEKRRSSVSFSRSEQPSDIITDEDNIQLSLAPHVQTYLSQVSQESGCWGKCLPIPFERAASKSWWYPVFDSEILEEQYKKSASPHNRLKFRYALWYILLVSLSWFFYFLSTGISTSTNHWQLLCTVLAVLAFSTITVLLLTYQNFFNIYKLVVVASVAVTLCILSLAFLLLIPLKHGLYINQATSSISPVGHFSICTEILLLIYTVMPLRLYMCISIGVVYSSLFEILTWLTHKESYDIFTILVRILLHVCIHLIGFHILVMTNVRMRNTFMKVGQSLLVGQQLKAEKNLKESMLHSLMPPKVAQWLLNEDEHFAKNGMEQRNSNETSDIQSIFRPFNMNRMENVSILFADIVGFTKISSTKSAEELVDILNKLFQKFDILCKHHHCEKISTLGDCYYCVSGCPQPRTDHAKCCVEMGLSMIQAIKQFDEEHNQGVNMRVGVHTGTVLCGIVGTKRFKFDVWSNDVTLANRMESTGKPGMVHISEKTCEFLQDTFLLEDGKPVFGLKTYFILGRKCETLQTYNGSFKALDRRPIQPQSHSLQLIISPPTTPPISSPQTRPRVLSCDNSHIKTNHNPNMLSPDICKMKASSLPSILDEQEMENDKDSAEGIETVKTPTSTASSGRYSVKIRTWKIPSFLRKSEPVKTDIVDLSNDSHSSFCMEDPVTTTGGYQPIPTIVQNPTLISQPSILKHKLKVSRESSNANVQENERPSGPFVEEQKDSIDVKSYISQSRSDIGQYEYTNDFSHFIRSGSYRSQYSKSPNEYSVLNRVGSNRSRRGRSPNLDMLPVERTRSATVATSTLERPKKNSDGTPCRLSTIVVDDQLSVAYSVNSRKDSGIKSNSRRSSIQQIENQLLPCDTSQQRVSDYFTSSQTSIASPHYVNIRRPSDPFFEKIGTGIHNLRKQSDLQLIKCVQKNSESERSYFIKPPLSKFTLFFENKKMENEYRKNVHSITEQESIITLASARFNTYFDVFVSAVIFFVVSFCLFLLYKVTKLWLVMFIVLFMVQVCAIALCFRKIINFSESAFSFCSRWYRWNTFGGILVSLPVIAVLCNFVCLRVFFASKSSDYLYSYLLFIGLIHFCNFMQLNCWMKNCLATIFGAIFICLILSGIFPCSLEHASFNQNITVNDLKNYELERFVYLYDFEILLDVLLLLILVWLLNREFEIGYRLSFHANYVANRDKIHVQHLKNQADWLIYNIVPEHVAHQLKKNAKYSENFKDVAIIFASIVNFNEMYDESYLGGKEFLRVLNELIGDFDELLTLPEFRCVEKIKTIGSTFMAASGLNSTMRLEQGDPSDHLYALMDFAIAMQNVIDNFNRDLLEFNLILRIGYNFGDITAAVIGNTKLYYDIWGDAVNIASRMDSTGVNGRIQVGEHCLGVLEKVYNFEPRGTIYVKGKDNMNVFLLIGKKDET